MFGKVEAMMSLGNHLCLFAFAKSGWEEEKQCNRDWLEEVVINQILPNNYTGSKKAAVRGHKGVIYSWEWRDVES